MQDIFFPFKWARLLSFKSLLKLDVPFIWWCDPKLSSVFCFHFSQVNPFTLWDMFEFAFFSKVTTSCSPEVTLISIYWT